MEKPASHRFPFPAGRMPAAVLPAALLLAMLLLTVYLLLPLAAQRFILPRVFKAAGIQAYAVSVQRLGLFGLQAGPLRIGPEEDPGIYVASLSAAYTPYDLLHRRVARIILAGVRIRVREGDDGGFAIPGLPLPAASADTDPVAGLAPPPVAAGTVRVNQGTIIVQRKGRHLTVPFKGVMTAEEAIATLDAALEVELGDRPMTVNARVDLDDNRIAVDWNADSIQFGWAWRLTGLASPPLLTGSGHVDGRMEGRLAPFAIRDLAATVRHTPCRLYWDAIRLDLSGETPGQDLEVRIRSAEVGQLVLETSPLRVRLPDGGQGRFTLTGRLSEAQEGGLRWQGRLDSLLSADSGRGLPGLILPLALTMSARLGADGRWQAEVDQAAGEAPQGSQEDAARPAAIRLAPTLFKASAEGTGRSFRANLNCRFADLAAAAAGSQISVGTVEGVGRYQVQNDVGEGRLTLTMAPVTVDGAAFKTRLERILCEVDAAIDAAAPPRLDGRVTMSGGSIRLSEPALTAVGFNARLPLAWPPPSEGTPGAFSLASLQWEGRALGSVAGRLQQTARGLDFTARHDSRLLPGLKASVVGTAGLAESSGRPSIRVRWTAERSSQATPLSVAGLMPNPPEFPITFEGRLFARGEATYRDGLTGTLTAGIEAGRLRVDEKGLVIDGLATEVSIPDIGHPRSAPAQKLTFDAAAFGTLRAENGQLGFQLEPGGVFFLEGGRFRWCGGSVIAPATRFRAGENRYALTVFCDRLKLDMLLEQLGMGRAEGGGAISGLIPLTLENGLVSFDNAFLYSTPGEGGVIRVQGSEVLTAGIPPGTPQYNQMELARQALKDYDYDWAKITLNTEADNLLVQLQFDGKPAEALPFVYDPEAGGFVKAAPGKPGSVFQGIRLDVNVTLPLNRMLRYRELFKRLQ